jgi:5-formyltetrahydrofolate cyclo-ligase
MLFQSQIKDFFAFFPWVRARKEQNNLRVITEQKRRMLSAEQVASDSASIVAQIERMSAFQDAKTVMLYYPVHNEVDLRPLLTKYAGQKTFLLPVTHRHSIEVRPYDGEEMMRKGHFGIPEPQTNTYRGSIDLILVPGVLFDRHRRRIGRGGGYYDRFLSRQRRALKIGVCYSFQLYKHSLPSTWSDRRVDRIVTPDQTIG